MTILRFKYASRRNKRSTPDNVDVDEQQDAWQEPRRLYTHDYVMFGITALFAILFGAIHCAGWSYIFLSPASAKIWRTCSVAITVTPCLILARVFWSPSDWELECKLGLTEKLCTDVMGFIAFVSIGVYVVARTVLWVGGSFGGVEKSVAGSLRGG